MQGCFGKHLTAVHTHPPADIKPVQAVDSRQGLQVAMAGEGGQSLLNTEWKLYLVQEW
jgi:hypothetical protein